MHAKPLALWDEQYPNCVVTFNDVFWNCGGKNTVEFSAYYSASARDPVSPKRYILELLSS